jgi:hypothetical protein
MMRLWCPSCDREFGAVRNPRNKSHHEFVCPSCSQALQWDWQSVSSDTMYGPPKECEHDELKNNNARVPSYYKLSPHYTLDSKKAARYSK